jgi:hypothetical protein
MVISVVDGLATGSSSTITGSPSDDVTVACFTSTSRSAPSIVIIGVTSGCSCGRRWTEANRSAWDVWHVSNDPPS